MNFFKRIYKKIHQYYIGFMFGLKNTETEIFTSIGGKGDAVNTHIAQETSDESVARALLRGELTQQVKELRYRTYNVSRESKQYEYFSPTLAKKRDKNDNKFISYENSENLEIITIQYNEQNIGTVEEALETVEYKDGNFIYHEPVKKYSITLGREYISRYNLEEFTKRIVIKKLDDNGGIIIDFYISKYIDDKNFKSKGFLAEINRIISGYINSDIIDISSVYFITNHAYKQNDMLEYEFNNIKFIKIVEYDGNYILKFSADTLKNGIDLAEKYFCKEMSDKYKNKEKKEITLDLSDKIKIYKCEMCGKEIIYDINNIDSILPSSGSDIDNEEKECSNATEFMDAQIIEQTYGRVLCNDCLKKYLSEIN